MADEHLESRRIGRALAAQSHELKNVLAIVGESAGLMEDLLELAQAQGYSLPETVAPAFERSMRSITAQVSRGHRLCTDLNIMAHMSDWRENGALPLVDLGEVGALAVRYMERPARQSEVTLEPCDASGHKTAADPLALLTALMALLESAWQGLAPGAIMKLDETPGTAILELDPGPAPEEISPEAAVLARAAGLELSQNDGRLRVTLKEGVQ